MDDQPASRCGPYVLEQELGHGGMGVVYRAYDTEKGRTVALKLLAPGLAADPVFQRRFRAESERAARLSDPHIIPIHDYGQVDGRLFIDMRLVNGIDLARVLRRYGPLPPPVAAGIIEQVASALDAAYRALGLVHRDVKPSNILIAGLDQSAPFAYLIDFGIARAIEGTALATNTQLIGTLAYMAPERFQGGQPADQRLDVYSLACVLYECLTGTEAFPGEMVAVMWAHQNTAPPPPSSVRPGVSPALDAVVARGMAKLPADRYATPGELAAAAVAAAASASATAAPPAASARAPARVPRPGGRRQRAAVVLAVIGVAGLLLSLLYLMSANSLPGIFLANSVHRGHHVDRALAAGVVGVLGVVGAARLWRRKG